MPAPVKRHAYAAIGSRSTELLGAPISPYRKFSPHGCKFRIFPASRQVATASFRSKLEAVSAALEDGYEVVFELVTTGELTVDAKNDLAAFQSTIAEFEHPEASLNLVDYGRDPDKVD